jgi:hypothetical protein
MLVIALSLEPGSDAESSAELLVSGMRVVMAGLVTASDGGSGLMILPDLLDVVAVSGRPGRARRRILGR